MKDEVDKNPKWDVEVFQKFVDAKVCDAEDKARFFLFNVMRNPALRRYEKVKDRLAGDKELLEEVLKYFDMSDCTLFEAMHLVFGHALPLPGEAQKIDRVMEAFGREFYRQCGGMKVGNNEDSFFILAFAVIMLNSDLHNPSVKRR